MVLFTFRGVDFLSDGDAGLRFDEKKPFGAASEYFRKYWKKRGGGFPVEDGLPLSERTLGPYRR